MSIYWTAWLVVIVLTFAAGETYALIKKQKTLSRYVWEISKHFPLFPWIAGVLTGVLAAHFWWGGALICFAPVK